MGSIVLVQVQKGPCARTVARGVGKQVLARVALCWFKFKRVHVHVQLQKEVGSRYLNG